ncbi:hypothetical protein K8089_04830 [Aequorivita sp. F47161]|uniref:Uncharacterized protein n=1 Tax=Aequorivita vitellina TaxID=2874475 RepID=A0A9X1U2A0_9FLAO|nr:hypothetical protein [Aequorivita vitellina]MCG2418338.1 hypothetical protein [Aequorivita vitellina]
MKNLFENLFLYEIVLLFLGIFLFLLLSVALVYYIIKKEEIKKLLIFFVISLLMIGYPSIQQISISADKFELTKVQEDYIENPNDSIAKQKLEALTQKLEKRAESARDILQISKSKLLLGNTDGAIEFANKAIEKEYNENKQVKTPDISSDTLKPSLPLVTIQAYQLKELAKFQNNITAESDTVGLKTKLQNMEVNQNLSGTKAVVKRNVLEKTKKLDKN